MSLCLISASGALLLGACDDQMRPADAPPAPLATMPRAPQATSGDAPSPTATDASVPSDLPAETTSAPLEGADAGVAIDDSPHMMHVTACWVDKRGCLRAQPSPPPSSAAYRVVSGGGGGAIRTRGQAMADLYGSIRDRLAAGEHLAAAPHHVGEPPAEGAQEPPRPRTHASDDPLVEAAFQLMAEVDRNGELTVDSVPRRAPSSCKLALGSLDVDAGQSQCLVEGASSKQETGTGTGPGSGTGRTGRGH